MINLTFEQFDKLQFSLYDGNPIIRRFGLSRLVADPSVLTPDESDGRFHLFCHSMFGVLHYQSDDGLHYHKPQMVVKDAMRPDVKRVGDTYYLYYERVQPLLKRGLAMLLRKGWHSTIYMMNSKDLRTWSRPREVISCDREYQRCDQGVSISNPFLIKTESGYRLYYSAGLTYLEDCHFSEPTHLSFAESDSVDGEFVSREAPIMSPDPDDEIFNRGCGCIKVYRLVDCYIGLINGIYVEDGKSHSAVMLFRSGDGLHFEYVKHLIKPQICGKSKWMAQYVYACNLVVRDGIARIYFNARNKSNPLSGEEHIGVAEAKL